MHIRYYISLIVALMLFCKIADAQTRKHIDVSATESFSDHIDLSGNNDGLDVIVKFVFDEGRNTLTMNIISYNRIVVFPQDSPLKGVAKKRRIMTTRLPFVMEAPLTTQLYMTKDVMRTLSHRKPKNVLGHWMECDGLVAMPQEQKLRNDYVAQTFQFMYKDQTEASIRLRDIYMMRDISKPGKKWDKEEIFYVNDLDRTYTITIHRDPCVGKEPEISSLEKMTANIADSWNSLKKDAEKLDKNYSSRSDSILSNAVCLVEKYNTRIDTVHQCESLMAATYDYNAYVDSIHALRERIEAIRQIHNTETLTKSGSSTPQKQDASSTLLSIARQLDVITSQSLNSTDHAEKLNLKKDGQKLMARGQSILSQKNYICSDLSVGIFRKAQKYFQSSIR